MSTADPKREFAVEVVQRLIAAGYQALWAGGCVRDLVLGLTPQDYDVATNARPDDVRQVFGRRRTLAVGESFGVIIVRGPRGAGQVEVATFRSEGPYLDGRRPEHVSFTSAEEDARRRDFTINGMFYDPLDERVLDYVGGEEDLNRGIVRAIGNPRDRMAEDKLRLLRAVRFAARFDFEIEPATADAVRDMAEQILVVSAERIAQELRRMLIDHRRRRAMELALELRLLGVIFPELRPLWEPENNTAWQMTLTALAPLDEPSFELAAAVLFHRAPVDEETVRAICRRLRLSNDETDHIAWLFTHRDALADAPNLSLARLKRLLTHRYAGDLLAMVRAVSLAGDLDPGPVEFCEEFLRNTPADELHPPPLVTGNDLIARDWRPGPKFKDVLESIRDAQLNGDVRTREEALRLLDGYESNDGETASE